MNRFFIILIAFMIFALFLSCTNDLEVDIQEDPIEETEIIKLGLLTGLGGLGDRSYNDMMYRGMVSSSIKYDLEFEYLSPISIEDNDILMERLIDSGCNVIFAGGGFHQKNTVDKYSEKFPEILFILLDDYALNYHHNVCSITFKQNEGSFLAGYLASRFSKTKKIAVIASLEEQVINDFIIGYKAGAKLGYPDIEIKIRYIDHEDLVINPFMDPETAYDIAIDLIKNHDIDIIYHVAAGSGIGVINAARDNNIYAIGVDSDQDYLAKGTVLTSVMKNIDSGIMMIVSKIIEDSFENKDYQLGLRETGVSLSPMSYTRDIIPEDLLEDIDILKQRIINGEIIVPSAY